MAGLARMDEKGRRSGGRQRRGDLARDVAGLAHAGDDDAAFDAANQLCRRDKGGSQAIPDGGGEGGNAPGLGLKRAQCRFDQRTAVAWRGAVSKVRLRHIPSKFRGLAVSGGISPNRVGCEVRGKSPGAARYPSFQLSISPAGSNFRCIGDTSPRRIWQKLRAWIINRLHRLAPASRRGRSRFGLGASEGRLRRTADFRDGFGALSLARVRSAGAGPGFCRVGQPGRRCLPDRPSGVNKPMSLR